MFNLTFEQSEKVTDLSVTALMESMDQKKVFTMWHFIMKFFASLFFAFCVSIMAVPILMFPKVFDHFTALAYIDVFLVLIAIIISFIVYMILSFTKNIAIDHIFSMMVLCFYAYLTFFMGIMYVIFYLFFMENIQWFLVILYGFILILSIVKTMISYVSFKKSLDESTDQLDFKLKKFNKFIAKYGSIIIFLCIIFVLIKHIFFKRTFLINHSFGLFIAIFVFIPIMIFVAVYLCLFYMPLKGLLTDYYFLKYKKEYQKKILDEYQVDFFNLEKHNKKYN